MKNAALLFSIVLLVGCSGGSSELNDKDNASAQSSFSRPLNDAEKAKMGGNTPASGAAAPPAKKPIGG